MTLEEEIQKLKTTISKQRKSRKVVNKELANEKLRYSELEERFNKLAKKPKTPLRKQVENLRVELNTVTNYSSTIKMRHARDMKAALRDVDAWKKTSLEYADEADVLKEELRNAREENRNIMVEILEAQLPTGFHNILNRLLKPEDYR